MKCIKTCPKHVIELVPYKQKTMVKCKSVDTGKEVRINCSVGCIGCKMCERTCPKGCIKVTDNLAEIDYTQCINCGFCAAVCPTHAIYVEYPERMDKIKETVKKQQEKKKQAAEAAKAAKAAETVTQ